MSKDLITLKDTENDLILKIGDYVVQIRNIDHILPRNIMDRGWGNGYVGLPETHPWYGMDYEYIPVEIYCGLTFGQFMEYEGVEYYVIGFDTAHGIDTLAEWPKEKVLEETMRLLQQCRNAEVNETK